MIKKNITRALTLGLCAAILVPSAMYAKEFKDVKKTGKYSWVYDTVDELTNKGIIAGYDDGEFKPDRAVSFEEVFRLLQGVINPSKDELNKAMKEYEKFCEDNGVTAWAREAVSFALYRNIISEATVKDANSKGFFLLDNKKFPNRGDIAIFFAKGLDLSPNGNEALLRHKDKDSIKSETKGYLASLIQAGIFTATGSDGNFEGDRYIRRSEMATITKLSNDYVASHPISTKVETLKGTVILASNLDHSNILIIEQGSNKYSFDLNNATEYKNNGKKAAFKDLQQGQEVEVQYIKGTSQERSGTAKVVEIKSAAQDLVGYVNIKSANNITIRYRQNTKDVNLKSKNKISTLDTGIFEFESNAKIYRFGKEIKESDIKVDDMILFKTNPGGKIKEATVYPKKADVQGKVVDWKDSSYDGFVTLRLDDNKDHTFHIVDRDVKGIRNLRKGDYVTLELVYQVIDTIREGVNNELSGRVVEFALVDDDPFYRNEGYIRIRDRNGYERNYTIDRYTRFEDRDRRRYDYRDLERSYRSKTNNMLYNRDVTLEIRNNIVDRIIEIDNYKSNDYYRDDFIANIQLIKSYKSFPNDTVNYVFKVLQSNNPKMEPGKEITFKEPNDLKFRDLYEVFRIEGKSDGWDITLRDQGSLNRQFIPLGNPKTELTPDRYTRDDRYFENYYSPGNVQRPN
ncbi:MAG: S-layer homology domain-containing protein [Tissierellia bacterium]|nr:S-layer homology domain-containing protein [Tissierellia bacterium]